MLIALLVVAVPACLTGVLVVAGRSGHRESTEVLLHTLFRFSRSLGVAQGRRAITSAIDFVEVRHIRVDNVLRRATPVANPLMWGALSVPLWAVSAIVLILETGGPPWMAVGVVHGTFLVLSTSLVGIVLSDVAGSTRFLTSGERPGVGVPKPVIGSGIALLLGVAASSVTTSIASDSHGFSILAASVAVLAPFEAAATAPGVAIAGGFLLGGAFAAAGWILRVLRFPLRVADDVLDRLHSVSLALVRFHGGDERQGDPALVNPVVRAAGTSSGQKAGASGAGSTGNPQADTDGNVPEGSAPASTTSELRWTPV